MKHNLCPESSQTECIAGKTGISDHFCFKLKPRSLQRSTAVFTRQHSTLSPRVVDPTRKTVIIRQRIFDSRSNHCIAAYAISPNLPPCEFFLFPRLKRALKGYRCADIQAVQMAVTKELCRIPESAS